MISGLFWASMIAAAGRLQLTTGPQKCCRGHQLKERRKKNGRRRGIEAHEEIPKREDKGGSHRAVEGTEKVGPFFDTHTQKKTRERAG
jgi:hypothetical protein